MVDNNVDELDLTFTYETALFGRNITTELMPHGFDMAVTQSNKMKFIKRVFEMKIQEEINQELDAFLKGFYLIIPHQWIELFTASELQLLIGGVPDIDVVDMEENAEYSGFTKESPIIKWIWEIFNEFSQKELATFIFFVSGS